MEVICNELSQTTIRLTWDFPGTYERAQIDCTMFRGGKHVALYYAGPLAARLYVRGTAANSTGTGCRYHSTAKWVIGSNNTDYYRSNHLRTTRRAVQWMIGYYDGADAQFEFDRWLGDCAHAERMVVV